MSKQSIAWHEEVYAARLAYCSRLERELATLQEKVARAHAELEVYKAQIERAQREGKAEFDAERYGVVRVGGKVQPC